MIDKMAKRRVDFLMNHKESFFLLLEIVGGGRERKVKVKSTVKSKYQYDISFFC
jgi:hypothetical protein